MAEEDKKQPPPLPKGTRSQAAQREVGYANRSAAGGVDWWNPDDDEEPTAELQWPLNLAVYDAMPKQDAQVGSVLRAMTHPILGTQWRIDPNGARDEVVEHIARDFGLPIKGAEDTSPGRLRDRFSWSDHLRHALLMFKFGHMPFEQLYRFDPVTGVYHLRKLGPRFPRSIAKFNVARDGGLISIEQHPASAADTKNIPLPVSRLVMYVNEREGGNWRGQSLLRPVYKNWLLKDEILWAMTVGIRRQSVGVPVYTDAEGGGKEGIEAGQEITTKLRSGEESGASIPYGAILKLLGVEGDLIDTMGPVRYHDEQIARMMLAHFLNLGTQTGSWALGSVFADTFTQSLSAPAQYIADTTTAHVIEDLVDISYGEDEPAPRLVFDDIGSNAAALAMAIKILVDAGVLTPDEQLEAHMRLGLGLPTKTQGDTRDTSAA